MTTESSLTTSHISLRFLSFISNNVICSVSEPCANLDHRMNHGTSSTWHNGYWWGSITVQRVHRAHVQRITLQSCMHLRNSCFQEVRTRRSEPMRIGNWMRANYHQTQALSLEFKLSSLDSRAHHRVSNHAVSPISGDFPHMYRAFAWCSHVRKSFRCFWE